MSRFQDGGASRTAGTLKLTVRYDGTEPDLGGYRSQYAYEMTSTDPDLAGGYSGNDLFSGVGAQPSSEQMARTLASFLGDAAERYRTRMRAPDREYPAWLYEAAYLNSDELAMIALEQDALDSGEATISYVDVVFQQGEDAQEALAILDAYGEAAAVQYLARWDGAHDGGRVYDEVPAGTGDRLYVDDQYVLNYNFEDGSIGLARKVVQYAEDHHATSRDAMTGPEQTQDRRLYDFASNDPNGPDRNGVADAFGQIHSDADPGL